MRRGRVAVLRHALVVLCAAIAAALPAAAAASPGDCPAADAHCFDALPVDSAWEQAIGLDTVSGKYKGEGVTVASIDTGVTPTPNLGGRLVARVDLTAEGDGLDRFGHGTHMAGLIAGRDDGTVTVPDPTKFKGIAPDARIVNVKVGANDGAVDVSQVIAAIDWVVQHRNDNGMNIRVLNLSYGTDSSQSYLLDPLAYATEVAWRKGIVVVVAGGNDGRDATTLADPAIDPFVIAVGADDPNGTVGLNDDAVASFSSRGNVIRHVDVLAPGKSVVSLRNPGSHVDIENPTARVGGRFFKGSGTSQAAAITSGAVALLLQQRPNLTPDQAKALLMGTANSVNRGTPILSGSGIIDVGRALAAPTPARAQVYPYSLGTGSLERARGSAHLVDPTTGAQLTGEQDIFGKAWNGSSWSGSSWSGSSWSGGMWNGSSWSGSSWSGSSWSGSSWSGSSWSGSSWSGSSWSGSSWSGSSWSGSSWSGSSWSGSSWSGSSWSGAAWA
jgi:serine protease AprX